MNYEITNLIARNKTIEVVERIESDRMKRVGIEKAHLFDLIKYANSRDIESKIAVINVVNTFLLSLDDAILQP